MAGCVMPVRSAARVTLRSSINTYACERLLGSLAPTLHELDASIAALSELRDKPAGMFRITSVEHAAKTVLCPALARLLPGYPDISVEVIVDYNLSDIVTERFDAGVRLVGQVAKDMIAVRIAPDIPMVIVGSPDYFRRHSPPADPHQLLEHCCINLRLPTSRSLYPQPLAQDGRSVRVCVEGPLVFNSIELIRTSPLDDLGLGFLPLDQVRKDLNSGRLASVLDECIPPLPGYHLYYPSRRTSPAFKLLVEALRYRSA